MTLFCVGLTSPPKITRTKTVRIVKKVGLGILPVKNGVKITIVIPTMTSRVRTISP